jgi:hypothetical protein
MTKFLSGIYFVTISAPDSSNGYIPSFFKVGEYGLSTSFRYSHGVGDIAHA